MDNIKWTNVFVKGVPDSEKKERSQRLFEELMAENFSSLMKGINLQIQAVQLTPGRIN